MTVSRYQNVGTATFVSASGDQIPYQRRRLLPLVDPSSPARVHAVRVGELGRPDLIAATEVGQAELSWLLADMNPVMRPSELCQKVGESVRVPQSSGVTIGQISAQ